MTVSFSAEASYWRRALRGVPTPEEARAEVIRLLDSGLLVREVARRLDESKSNVSRWYAWEKKARTVEKKRTRELNRRRARYRLRDFNKRDESFRLSDHDRERLRDAFPVEVDEEQAGLLVDCLQDHASRGWNLSKPFEKALFEQWISDNFDAVFGDVDGLKHAKAEAGEIIMRAMGAPARKLDVGEVRIGTASESRAIRRQPKPDPEMVAAGVALWSGERAPLLGQRVAERVRELAGEDSAKARDGVWREHEGGALKLLYREHRLTPVAEVRVDPVLRERCERLGVSLDERRV